MHNFDICGLLVYLFIFLYVTLFIGCSLQSEIFVLRPDHNLQDVRSKIFPYKRKKVDAPEAAPSLALPARRKERSLSSLVVSTPRVSSQMTGRRARASSRKTSRGSSVSNEKQVNREEGSESSSSHETLTKFTQNIKQV